MQKIILASPAKVNLYLRILGRRKNGYHDLYTLFHRISLEDRMSLRKRHEGIVLKCSEPSIPVDDRNIVIKAYRLLQEKFPRIGGVSVTLKKNIPHGAGLGGGSGNAATFLKGMRKLYRLPLSDRELMKMGARLGADVPFFLLDRTQAIGQGIGEQLKPLTHRRRLWFLLLVSRQGLSTARVYRALPRRLSRASLTQISRSVTILSAFLAEGKIDQAADLLQNDLESAAFSLRPSIRGKIQLLNHAGVRAARLSGSGPTVFAVFSRFKEAKDFVERLPKNRSSQSYFICHSK